MILRYTATTPATLQLCNNPCGSRLSAATNSATFATFNP